MLVKSGYGGLVLVSVLLFLLMFSVLAITALNMATLQFRMTQNLIAGDRLFYAAETGLRQASRQLMSGHPSVCLLTTQPLANYYAQQNAAWWLAAQTCHVSSGDIKASYVIEELTHVACNKIESAIKAGVNYYRITAWAISAASQTPTILQSTLAVTNPLKQDNVAICDKVHTLSAGQQSWLLLS